MRIMALMSTVLYRLEELLLFELRAAWGSGRRVVVLTDADIGRIEGVVTRVSATGATAKIGATLVPLGCVLALRYPSRLGDSDWTGGGWGGEIPPALRTDPRQLRLL